MEHPPLPQGRPIGGLAILAAGEAAVLIAMEHRFGAASLLWSVAAGGALFSWLLATGPRRHQDHQGRPTRR